MLVKGQIIRINKDTNTIDVRLPVFETSINQKIIVPATICYQPGNLNEYSVNDVVFVDFENMELNKPVIIGKLYTGDINDKGNYAKCKDLNVLNSAKLPKNTEITDANTSLADLIRIVNAIKDRLGM